ncbi:hypothetical protein M422DRAFT_257168 [Sphaerobolus stellatus SS14]|uniref:Altered inheritance of mitochondria protein 41 n=1 Tax=Sphaerobolus stellatus (strain SS14) TaxID=990650 RepID=A0A0C9VP34_SPHS4|nr:hypothetical protein M422DRAFT_257168 [Sphaerobolus stellatus SS14]
MRGLRTLRAVTRFSVARPQTVANSTHIGFRFYSAEINGDLTARLQADLKTALKARDSAKSTIIRSVLAEVYNAQKQVAPKTLTSSDVAAVVRKAEQRRLDSAKQFEEASRSDLAEKEKEEAALLASYLPPVLNTEQIDTILRKIIASADRSQNPKKAKGLALKAFLGEVDKSTVQTDVVKQRLEELWSA